MNRTHGRCRNCERDKRGTDAPGGAIIFRWPTRKGHTLRRAWCPDCYCKLRQTAASLCLGATILDRAPIFSPYPPTQGKAVGS